MAVTEPFAAPAGARPAPRRRGFRGLCGIFVGVQLILLLAGGATFRIIDAAGAYGELAAQSAIARKTVVTSLYRYAASADAADYRDFRTAVAVAERTRTRTTLDAWHLFDAAVADWRAGDELIAALRTVGDGLHDTLTREPVPLARRQALLRSVARLDRRLSRVQTDFAADVGEGTRRLRAMLLPGLLLLGLGLWGIGVTLSWRVYHRSSQEAH